MIISSVLGIVLSLIVVFYFGYNQDEIVEVFIRKYWRP